MTPEELRQTERSTLIAIGVACAAIVIWSMGYLTAAEQQPPTPKPCPVIATDLPPVEVTQSRTPPAIHSNPYSNPYAEPQS